jgi:tocopherol O-methyltransferase
LKSGASPTGSTASVADAVARHYDALDLWYRALWGDHLHHGIWRAETRDRREAAENLLRAVAEAARISPGERVCDVGCGYGGPARWLAAETGAEIVAVTNSAKQAAFARAATGEARVDFLFADWLDNGLPAASFDAVVAIESLAHFADPARTIGEMARVAKPGGRLVAATWMAGERVPPWVERWVLGPIRRTGESPGLLNAAAFRAGFAAAGLRDIRVERLGEAVARTWSIAIFEAGKALVSNRTLRMDALRYPLQAIRLAASAVRIRLAYRFGWLDYGIIHAVVGGAEA